MKRLTIILFGILLMLSNPAFAKTFTVEACSDFSTDDPPEYFTVKVLNEIVFDSKLTVPANALIKGKIENIKNPKRLKRNAVFTFLPVEYEYNGVTNTIEKAYPAKYTTILNKKDLAKSAVLGVGNHFIKGLSMGVSAIEGAVQNKEGNRFKSSVNEVYKDSPLSYVEKGQPITIEKNQIFYLDFKIPKASEEPNYEFEVQEQ